MSELKRRGRPLKTTAQRKSDHLKFRTRADIRERLTAAAKASGRSLSEEVERRIEQSFDASTIADLVEKLVTERLATVNSTQAVTTQSSNEVMAATSTGS